MSRNHHDNDPEDDFEQGGLKQNEKIDNCETRLASNRYDTEAWVVRFRIC